MTDAEKKQFIEEFKAGNANIYSVSLAKADLSAKHTGDLILKKISDVQTAIVGWRRKEDAEIFCRGLPASSHKVVELSWMDLKQYLDLFGDDRKKYFVLELI